MLSDIRRRELAVVSEHVAMGLIYAYHIYSSESRRYAYERIGQGFHRHLVIFQ